MRDPMLRFAIAIAIALYAAPPTAEGATRCGRVFIPVHRADAKMRVVEGRVACKAARTKIAAAFKARGDAPLERQRPRVLNLRGRRRLAHCYVGLAETQTVLPPWRHGGRRITAHPRRLVVLSSEAVAQAVFELCSVAPWRQVSGVHGQMAANQTFIDRARLPRAR
jgi:hypothetical protein